MGLYEIWTGGVEAGKEMARATTNPTSVERIRELVEQLRSSALNRDAFQELTASIADDKSLKTADVVAVASQFVGRSNLKTRKAALAAIGQERLRVAHSIAKADSATKTKVW